MKKGFFKKMAAFAVSAVMFFGSFIPVNAWNDYPNVDTYAEVDTIKGQQTKLDKWGYEYGSEHAFHNFLINKAYIPDGQPNFYFEGKGYCFQDYDYYFSWIKQQNNAGRTVNVQFMIQWEDNKLVLIDESARTRTSSPYYAPATDGDGKQILRAFWAWLMESLANYDAHIDNIILGNEVNMPNHWHYSGSGDAPSKYASAFYEMRKVVRNYSDKTRLSICVDHSWNDNDEGRGISVKGYLASFNNALTDLNGGQPVDDWCISMHLYPAILYEPEIWTSRVVSGLNTPSADSRFVDGKNLSYITNYIKDTYGENHRIMMTEQGFSIYRGEEAQAASLAYTYYACKYDPMVDSFILLFNESEDSKYDFAINGRMAEYVYTYIDDPAFEEELAQMLLPVIGVGSWSDIIPNYGQTIERKPYVGSDYVPRIHVSGFSLNVDDEINIGSGEVVNIEAVVEPENAYDKTVNWMSYNDSIAQVNDYGRLVGVSEGTTFIRVWTNDGNFEKTLTVNVTVSDKDRQMLENKAMFRLYNPNSGEHFYTGSLVERNNTIAAGWDYEGLGWYAADETGKPVYRLYNQNAGDHHYTTNEAEKNTLVSIGWNDEGIGWYDQGEDGVPMYRLYNPNAESGSHHYTSSETERDYLVSIGWSYEGIGWYGRRK